MYILSQYPDIEELNIIPTSTLYHEDTWLPLNIIHNKAEAKATILEMKYKSINAICINKKSVSKLLEYLIQ